MREVIGQIEARGTYRGHGQLRRGSFSVDLPAFEVSRDPHSLTSRWEFFGFFSPDCERLEDGLDAPGPEKVSLVGVDHRGLPLQIPAIDWHRRTRSTIEGVAQELVLGSVPFLEPPAKQLLTVFLTPTPVAYRAKLVLTQSWTGEITQLGDKADEPLPFIPLSVGMMELSVRHRYDSAKAGATEATIQLPVPALHGELAASALTSEPVNLLRSVLSEIELFLRLISFLSRQHVRWTRAELASMDFGPGNSDRYNDVRILRAGMMPERPHRGTPLVWPGIIKAADLPALYDRFLALPYRDAASTAMLYLVESSQSEFATIQFINAFTAFETLLTAIADHTKRAHVMPSGRFDKLSRQLRHTIQEHSRAELSDAQVATLTSKLAELNRTSLASRACDILTTHKVAFNDLWPDVTELADGLRGPVKRRNLFLHAGKSARPLQVHVDALRIKALTERLVFALLGGKETWFHLDAYPRPEDFRLIDEELAADPGSQGTTV